MRNSARAVLVSLFCVSILPSCGGAVGEGLRPGDHTASGALGGKSPACTGEPKYAKPLIVDLDPDARVDLEATMKKGVAVVAYDCNSFRVLSACRLPDANYEYAGVTRREQVVQMNSVDELHANIPISSAKLGAELQSGRSIDLALVMVGQRTTAVSSVTRAELQGGCEGATHFVQTATLGAFSMATGSVGKVAAVAEMFNYGGGAKSEAERKAMNKDGSLDDCRKSEPDGDKPPSECRAPLRIELFPIAGAAPIAAGDKDAKGKEGEKKKDVAAAENPCPEGFVFNDDVCTRASAQKAHLCDAKDETECKTQCEKGSAESCFNYARFVKKAKSSAAAMPMLKKACDGGFADGCAELGRVMSPSEATEQDEAKAALAMLNKACDMGSGFGCDLAGDLLTDKDFKTYDVATALKRYDRGCDLGYGTACWSLANVYFRGAGVTKDTTKGMELLLKACQGGSADECAELGTTYAKGRHDQAVDKDRAYRYQRRACDLDTFNCEDAAKYALAADKDTEAFALATRGCTAKDDAACLIVADLYNKGRGTAKDEDKAKATWTAICKDGDGDEDACKRLGIKMKD